MKKVIRCMIFDFGGVIGLPHDRTRLATMKALTNMSDEFEEAYFLHRFDYDIGHIDQNEYWHRITGGRMALSEDLIHRLVKEDYLGWTNINDKMITYIRALGEKVDKVVLLSNINFEAKDYIFKELHMDELFDETFCSCDLELMKPDVAIYEHVLKEIQVDPGNCLFMDDSLANIHGAQQVGMNGIHFKNYGQFQETLLANYDLRKS